MLPSATWGFLILLALNFIGMSLKFFISSILTSICISRSFEAWCYRFFMLISIIYPLEYFSSSRLSFYLAALWWTNFFFFYYYNRSNSLCYNSISSFLNLSMETLSIYFTLSTLSYLIKSRLILFYTIFVNEAGFFKVFVSKSFWSSVNSAFCSSWWLTSPIFLLGELQDLAVNPTVFLMIIWL